MDTEALALIARIESAFAGVTLGGGIGLAESVALDYHEAFEDRATARLRDEKMDWHKLIDDPELTRKGFTGGPIFMDAEGLRFYLPAYLITAIKDPTDLEDPVLRAFAHSDRFDHVYSVLVTSSIHGIERFLMLSTEQRVVVGDAILYIARVFELDYPEMQNAIDSFWHSTQ